MTGPETPGTGAPRPSEPIVGTPPQDEQRRPVDATGRERRGDWMQTYTGRQFWPLDPDEDEVTIDDIAHALSMICRYNGHVTKFYSVAEHSVIVSHNVPKEFALHGLLHDSAEAYIGDMVRPLKNHMQDFRDADSNLLSVIGYRFGLDMGLAALPEEVKDVDNRILLDERREFLVPSPAPWGIEGLKPLGVRPYGMSQIGAKMAFLRRFHELTNERWT